MARVVRRCGSPAAMEDSSAIVATLIEASADRGRS
jgi:hypothetical protein